jgi:tetratricopeptide (TPR) repeat protein
MIWLLGVSLAQAELPPPDYRDAVLGSVEAQADAMIQAGDLGGALNLVQEFRSQVASDARLAYEEGLIRRLQGDLTGAEQCYREAVQQDPKLFFAWYDLGELLLQTGDLDGAEKALTQAFEQSAHHPQGWVAPMRLAELAAQRGDAAAFDSWLKEAVRRGFRFATIAGTPAWMGYFSDPALREVIERLATVYGEESVLETLQ